MSNPASLDITIGNRPGFTQTTATNGTNYYFVFSGGDDGNGNFTEVVGTPVDLVVNLICDPRWVVRAVNLTDPDAPNNPQLTCAIASDGRSITIHDLNTTPNNGYYAMTIVDNNPSAHGCTFVCDPGITNRAPG